MPIIQPKPLEVQRIETQNMSTTRTCPEAPRKSRRNAVPDLSAGVMSIALGVVVHPIPPARKNLTGEFNRSTTEGTQAVYVDTKDDQY